MRKRLCLLCIALLLLSSIAGAEGAALVDDRGAAIPATAPQRVVSLYGSYAEAWAQAGGTLVGATEDAVSERGMDLGTAQIIGTTKAPNLERTSLSTPIWSFSLWTSPRRSAPRKCWKRRACPAPPSASIPGRTTRG